MNNEELKNQIVSLISEISSCLEQIRIKHIQTAYNIGITRDNLDNMLSFFNGINLSDNIQSDYSPFLSSAKDYLTNYRNQVQTYNTKYDDLSIYTHDITSSGIVFTAASGTAWSVIDDNTYPENGFIIPEPQHDREYYYDQFSKIDNSLGKTYKEIDEIIHTTESDPGRAGLYMVRQTFDHFFDVIAPDDDVRKSIYWKEKKPNESKDPKAVWRIEKIKYAAYTQIKDKQKAQSLVDQSNYMLSTYQLLNKAHNRKEINQREAKNLILSMKTILEGWIEAINS